MVPKLPDRPVAGRDPVTEARTYRYVAAGMLDEIKKLLALEEVLSNGVRAIPVRHQRQYTGGAFTLFAPVARAWIEAESALARAERALKQKDEESAALLNLAEHFFGELTERWHSSTEAPMSLAFYAGLTDEQYAALVECRYIDAAKRLASSSSRVEDTPQQKDER